jgi:iron complex transport system ATP-binding protein
VLRSEHLVIEVAGRRLADAVSLNVKAGDCCAVLGRNGSGKSSLLAVLAGLRRPTAGAVLLGNRPIEAWPRRERARMLGILLQEDTGDYWGTTLDYVQLGRYPHGGRDDVAHAQGLLAEFDLDRRAAQRYRTLSGGERQRARLAQLLAQDPQVLLLDEPLQHLDLAHQACAMATFSRLAREGRAVLMALHEPIMAARRWRHRSPLGARQATDHAPRLPLRKPGSPRAAESRRRGATRAKAVRGLRRAPTWVRCLAWSWKPGAGPAV